MKRTALLSMAVVVSLAVIFSASGNLLQNPGLETGDLTGWSPWGANWRMTTWGDDIHSGTNAVLDEILTTDTDMYRGIYQRIAVLAEASYDAGVWIRAAGIEDSRGWLEVKWYDIDGLQIGSQEQSGVITNSQDYTQSAILNMTSPVGTVTAEVQGVVYMASAPSTDTDYFMFDDFSFTETIPEPTTAVLVALGFGAAFVIGRHRAKV